MLCLFIAGFYRARWVEKCRHGCAGFHGRVGSRQLKLVSPKLDGPPRGKPCGFALLVGRMEHADGQRNGPAPTLWRVFHLQPCWHWRWWPPGMAPTIWRAIRWRNRYLLRSAARHCLPTMPGPWRMVGSWLSLPVWAWRSCRTKQHASPLAVRILLPLIFYAMGALPYRRNGAIVAIVAGLLGLTLSGAPAMALVLGLGSAALHYFDRSSHSTQGPNPQHIGTQSALIVLATLLAIVVGISLDLVRWKVQLPRAVWADWSGHIQLMIWFTWPAWPLALWTLWRWRHQLFIRKFRRHIALPAWFVSVCIVATLTTGSPDRSLLLALPALSTLAAFALPTLQRQVGALIDWFTLLFFSGCAFVIWVVWVAMQTGVPAQPAANVSRLAPGFSPSFSFIAFGVACVATFAWAWLVKWRVGRHRAAIWKSLVLPAGGATLSWLLLMTLWMPLLNYAQSYTALVQRTVQHMDVAGCVETLGLGQGQIAAFQFYGKLQLKTMQPQPQCPWLLVEPLSDLSTPAGLDTTAWSLEKLIEHPANAGESVLLFRRN
jgi:hypothetical protein